MLLRLATRPLRQQLSRAASTTPQPIHDALRQVLDNGTKKRRKFDESVDLDVTLNVDPRKPLQAVRGVVSLPHGVGRSVVVAAVSDDPAAQESAKAAGADVVGGEDLVEGVRPVEGLRAHVKADGGVAAKPFAAPAGWKPKVGSVVRLHAGAPELRGVKKGELAMITASGFAGFHVQRTGEHEKLGPFGSHELKHGFDGWHPYHAAVALKFPAAHLAELPRPSVEGADLPSLDVPKGGLGMPEAPSLGAGGSGGAKEPSVSA